MVMAVALCGCASSPSGRPDSIGATGSSNPHKAFATGHFSGAVEGFALATQSSNGKPVQQAINQANLGVALDAAGRYQEALNALDLALKLQPDMALIQFNRAIVLTNMGRYEAARDSYLDAARLAPDNTDIPYNLGILYEIHLNQPDQALTAYHQYQQQDGPHGDRVADWIAAITQRQTAK
jgi:tetratricopeptide (TPR) repeat protein